MPASESGRGASRRCSKVALAFDTAIASPETLATSPPGRTTTSCPGSTEWPCASAPGGRCVAWRGELVQRQLETAHCREKPGARKLNGLPFGNREHKTAGACGACGDRRPDARVWIVARRNRLVAGPLRVVEFIRHRQLAADATLVQRFFANVLERIANDELRVREACDWSEVGRFGAADDQFAADDIDR